MAGPEPLRGQPFPAGLRQLPGVAELVERFIASPKQGQIHHDPRISKSFRFRLVLLHEYVHLLHYPYRSQTRQWLADYLAREQQQGRLLIGKRVVAPLFIGAEDPPPAGVEVRTLYTRSDGCCMRLEMRESDLLIRIITDQVEELLADFLAAAGAGVSFWTTLLDFERTSAVDLSHADHARWELESKGTYDPHPIPLVRYRIFPMLLARVLGQCVIGPSVEWNEAVRTEMREDVERLVLSQFPEGLPDSVSYRNERAPADVAEVKLGLPIVTFHYEVAFEALSVLMAEWLNTNHPLALLTLLFDSMRLHQRIRDLAEQFVQRSPRPSKGWFDNIAGAAAARRCYDLNPGIDEGLLEVRARGFLERGALRSMIRLT